MDVPKESDKKFANKCEPREECRTLLCEELYHVLGEAMGTTVRSFWLLIGLCSLPLVSPLSCDRVLALSKTKSFLLS